MANRKKRLEKEQAKLKAALLLKKRYRERKELELKGNAMIFDKWKASKFNQGQVPKEMKRVPNSYHYDAIAWLNHLYSSKKTKATQEVLEAITRHPKLAHVSFNFYGAMARILATHGTRTNQLETWKPPKSNHENVLFRSLFNHLFVKYPLPKLVLRAVRPMVFITNHSEIRTLLFELARGKGIHQIKENKVKLNGKMNYFFMTAPERLSIIEALWWGKLRAMKVTEQVAYCIIGRLQPSQWIGWQPWIEDYVYFVNKLKLDDSKQLKDIFEFVMYQWDFRRYQVKLGEDYINVPVIYHNYSLKKRSLESVTRHLEEWSKQIQLVKRYGCAKEFPEPKLKGFKFTSKNHQYVIKRLKNYNELAEEGRQMKHCVSSYANECVQEESSIWSVRMLTGKGGFKRLATVEIEYTEEKYQLCEFQGKCNTKPSNLTIHMVRQWAKKEGFEMAEDWSY